MKLRTVRVREFKSVWDSNSFEIDSPRRAEAPEGVPPNDTSPNYRTLAGDNIQRTLAAPVVWIGTCLHPPSWKSMARVAFASKPALKSPLGSSKDAPLKKLSLT